MCLVLSDTPWQVSDGLPCSLCVNAFMGIQAAETSSFHRAVLFSLRDRVRSLEIQRSCSFASRGAIWSVYSIILGFLLGAPCGGVLGTSNWEETSGSTCWRNFFISHPAWEVLGISQGVLEKGCWIKVHVHYLASCFCNATLDMKEYCRWLVGDL